MDYIFKNITRYSILFFIVLAIDIFVKINYDDVSYRYLTQPLTILLCLLYYMYNQNGSKRDYKLVTTALVFFMIGRIFVLHDTINISILIGMILFTLGKVYYGIRFFNQSEFKLSNVIVLIGCCFAYMVVLLLLVYDSLKELFIPMVVYLFVSFLLLLLSFLRRFEVNYQSYLLVFIGIVCLAISEWMAIVDIFYFDSLMQSILVTLTYGVSHYFIVLGLLTEVKQVSPLNLD